MDSTEIQAVLDVRLHGKQPYIFDPEKGNILKLALYREEGERTLLPLSLTSHGSACVVFLDKTDSLSHVMAVLKDGKELFPGRSDVGLMITYNEHGDLACHATVSGMYQLRLDDGSSLQVDIRHTYFPLDSIREGSTWNVYFPHGWGFEPVQEFTGLVDWTSHEDKELSIFSGIASYETSFSMAGEVIEDQVSWDLDLGTVGEVARVYLNGHEVGTSVFPPHIFSVTGLLKEGQNDLVIEVANTWLNQLVGEKDKPFEKQRTRSNVGSGTREKMTRPWDNYRPLPSGLIGPVQLIQYKQVVLGYE